MRVKVRLCEYSFNGGSLRCLIDVVKFANDLSMSGDFSRLKLKLISFSGTNTKSRLVQNVDFS